MHLFRESSISRSAAIFVFVALGILQSALVRGQSQTAPFTEVHTVAAADRGVPVEHSFTIATTGTYKVTLTDLGKAAAPSAPLNSIKLAITNGATIVGTPLTGEGTTQFTATATGTYVVRVIGQPGSGLGSGPFGVQITNTADNSQLTGFSDTLVVPPGATPNVTTLNDSFTVPTAGNYTVTLADLKFPQNMNTLLAAVVAQDGSLPLVPLSAPGTSQTATLALRTATTYNLFAIGQANSTANAGLYALVVRDSSNAVVYSRTLNVGSLASLGKVTLTATGHTLTFTDLGYPAALSATAPLGVVVTMDDQVVAPLTTVGSRTFNPTAGQYQVYALATAAFSPGSYNITLQPTGGSPVMSVAQAVAAPGSSVQVYSFTTDVATAGAYSIQLADYQLPQALTSVSLAAVENGAALANPLSGAGSLSVNATAGKLSMLVFAQPPAGGSGSVFGLFATPTGGTPIFQTTQGVGAVFTSRKVTIAIAGGYAAGLTDVAFPTGFTELLALVTHGTTLVGSVAGGGSLPFAATAGDYFITFAAQPTAPDKAGTYAIQVTTVAAPTVTLTPSVTHVATGGSATLTWTSQNATSCTASGGWSGNQSTSGTTTTTALSANTTFTLACTGVGGTTTQSATITIDSANGGGGGGGGGKGGGGRMDLTVLAALAGLVLLQFALRAPRSRRRG